MDMTGYALGLATANVANSSSNMSSSDALILGKWFIALMMLLNAVAIIRSIYFYIIYNNKEWYKYGSTNTKLYTVLTGNDDLYQTLVYVVDVILIVCYLAYLLSKLL